MKNILLFISLILLSQTASANTVWEYVDSKLEKKKFKRWSLSSWMYDKEKFTLQDQWLSMNLGSDSFFFELYADYAGSNFDVDTANNLNETTTGMSSEVAAYIGFLGVSYRYEEYDTHYYHKETAINLRLIGTSHQSTHLALTYGNRDFMGVDETEEFSQRFYGGDISLYLLPFFGFDGRYRVYSNVEANDGTYEMGSTRSQWGAFIDISFIRIFTYQFEENFDFKVLSSGVEDERQTKGTATGIRLYF
jgi:hypothetical protein